MYHNGGTSALRANAQAQLILFITDVAAKERSIGFWIFSV